MQQIWDDAVVPSLVEYIRIPNKSPSFDGTGRRTAIWTPRVADGIFGRARSFVRQFRAQRLEVVRLEGRTPLIFIEIPGEGDEPVLLYGHLDKQPEFTGWAEGLGPWTPVIRGENLYGRGGADDGYAMYGALSAILALHDQKIPHARCVILIEACEESGSYDLPFYVDHLAERIGKPGLVVCLDSGCGDYDRLWLTTSLRGMAIATLTVRVLTEGVHSGDASGIVPSSFRIARQLLSRLEDERTGEILPRGFLRRHSAGAAAIRRKLPAAILGPAVYRQISLRRQDEARWRMDPAELILNRTWRPQLGDHRRRRSAPPQNAGNVLLPSTAAKLSLRLPPTLSGDAMSAADAAC